MFLFILQRQTGFRIWLTRWKVIEFFGGCFPGFRQVVKSYTKHLGNRMYKNAVIAISKRQRLFYLCFVFAVQKNESER